MTAIDDTKKVTTSLSDLRFRLTMNIIGICGPLLFGLVAILPDQKMQIVAFMFVLSLAGLLGFVLSCIDYARAIR